MLGLSEIYNQYNFLPKIILLLTYGINYVIKNLTWQQHLGFSPLHTPGLFDLTLHLPPVMLLPEDHAQHPLPLPPWEGKQSIEKMMHHCLCCVLIILKSALASHSNLHFFMIKLINSKLLLMILTSQQNPSCLQELYQVMLDAQPTKT